MTEPASGEPRGDLWYADGLRFGCTACGRCCTGEPGHVWIEKDEIRPMAAALGMKARAFRRRYVRRVGKRLSLRERENGDCVMLEQGRCSAYRAKPLNCSTFPFWPAILASRADWDETGESCQGVGRGRLYSVEEIQRIVDGDGDYLLATQRKGAGAQTEEVEQSTSASEPTPTTWKQALGALVRLYADLDADLAKRRYTCAASGKCCDFDAHGHRLYVTTLEAELFFRSASSDRRNDDDRLCPAFGGEDRLCKARDGRMLGCRTYFCGPYPEGTPDDLYERYHARIKALHDRFGIPFTYRDLIDRVRDR